MEEGHIQAESSKPVRLLRLVRRMPLPAELTELAPDLSLSHPNAQHIRACGAEWISHGFSLAKGHERAPEDSKDSFALISAVRVARDPEGTQ
jgi:hypothetical protein